MEKNVLHHLVTKGISEEILIINKLNKLIVGTMLSARERTAFSNILMTALVRITVRRMIVRKDTM